MYSISGDVGLGTPCHATLSTVWVATGGINRTLQLSREWTFVRGLRYNVVFIVPLIPRCLLRWTPLVHSLF